MPYKDEIVSCYVLHTYIHTYVDIWSPCGQQSGCLYVCLSTVQMLKTKTPDATMQTPDMQIGRTIFSLM